MSFLVPCRTSALREPGQPTVTVLALLCTEPPLYIFTYSLLWFWHD